MIDNLKDTPGLTFDSYETGISYFDRNQFITYKIRESEDKVWMAEITGIAPKFGFDRKFVRANWSNESDTLAKLQFVVSKNRLYEYRSFLVDEKSNTLESGFIIVTDDGELMTIDQDGVRKLLHMRVKGDPIKKKQVKKIEKEKQDIENSYQPDDIPF
jgi:hypothetical protein